MCAWKRRRPRVRRERRRSRYEGIVLRHARGCARATAAAARARPASRRRSGRRGSARRSARPSATSARPRVAAGEPDRAPKGLLRSPSRPRSTKRPRSGSPRPRPASSARAAARPTSPPRSAPTGKRSTTASSPRSATKRLTAISHMMLQDFADQLSAEGLSASSVRNTILPLRAIFRRAHRRGDVAINPTVKLALPAVRGRRDRIAAPTEVGPLLDALQPDDRAIYATALYAGLRARRTPSPPLGRHRPRHQPDPRHATGTATPASSHPRAAPATAASRSPPPSAANSPPANRPRPLTRSPRVR